jgi:hypothetical protein
MPLSSSESGFKNAADFLCPGRGSAAAGLLQIAVCFHTPAPRILVLSTINEQRSLHFQAKPRTMDVSKNILRAANLNLEAVLLLG